jgi:hypothetical protein
METMFYSFGAADEKGCVRIKSKMKYNTLDIIRKDSPLVKFNEFTVARGKKWFDIVQFDDSVNFAISKKTKDVLESNSVTGWGCFPIEISGAPHAYFAFQIFGIAGPILNLEARNNYEADYVEFDLASWDGSDIFNLKDTLHSACLPKVKQILEDAGITI